ncbi:MAG: GGDEF domain-containing protein, partial [Fibrobacter sp.]|nr:GGDEF domain-containing protein [Fibrobacter sp.]
MNWKLYILWLISFLAGVVFVYVLPSDSLSPSLRYIFLGVWGSVLEAIFNTITNKLTKTTKADPFDLLAKHDPETQLVPIVGGKEQVPTDNTPAFQKAESTAESQTPTIIAPEFPDEEWIDFTRELLHNRPFPEVIRKLSGLLPKIFKGASGVLYMYSNNQDELHQIFAFGEQKISDPTINRAECASFDSAKIVVADYSDPQHVSGCMHLHYRPQGYSLCAPVEGLEEHFGILTIQVDELPQGETIDSWKTKMSMVVTAFGLFVANQNLQIRFKSQSLRDQLTGLVNKRYLEEALTRSLSEARRHGTPIGMIMLSMDNLEYLRNTHGVHAEEQMLWELAQRLPRYIRTEDIPCRYGENTLCVLLPGADKIRTQQRAEKIRHEIENLQVAYVKLILQTTLSLGVATYPDNAKTAAELTSIAE